MADIGDNSSGRIGELVRTYWVPVVGLLASAVAYGALYQRVDDGGKKLDGLVATVQSIDRNLAGATEHAKGADAQYADLLERVRVLERRRN